MVRWGAISGEICTLLMLYSATLLAPIPFGFTRVSMIVLCASASAFFAYVASSRSRRAQQAKRQPFKEIIFKPPFMMWVVVIAIIMMQLANSLQTVYLETNK